MERLRRDWAAASSLRVAFPTVNQLRLDLTFVSALANAPGAQSYVLHPPARAFFAYPCPYANCDGQFDLMQAVHAALEDPAHRAEGVLDCTGVRAQKFDSKHPCQLRLIYRIVATRPGIT